MKKSTESAKGQLSLDIKLSAQAPVQQTGELWRTVGFKDSLSIEIRREAAQRVERSGIFKLPKGFVQKA
jgi:hypothetical protein